MALIPNRNLGDSLNDDADKRREITFDPFVGSVRKKRDGNFFTGVRDLTTNTLFNVLDSALFNVPSGLIKEKEAETEYDWQKGEKTFGKGFDALGIKPFENLSSAGRFGYGAGQALGFFVPFGALTKTTAFGARLAVKGTKFGTGKMIGNVIDDVVGDSILKSIKGTSSSNPITSAIKNTIMKNERTINNIYRATPEQYARFSSGLKMNVRESIGEFLKDTGTKISTKESTEIADKIVGGIEQLGKEGRYVDELADLISQFGVNVGNNVVSRNMAGYVGRAVNESINLFAYESLGNIARASMGAEIEGVDYNALESMKNSAGFASMLALIDFIPGGRKAGMVDDFYRMARMNLSKKRSYSKMFEEGKITKDQLDVIATWFGKKANILKDGKTIKDVSANSMHGPELAKWVDDLYTNARSGLLREIMKDGGKSLVGSLPRAGIDAVATALYMNGTENFMEAINDESMVADYLIGAFMAMRAYKPLDPTGRTLRGEQMNWRYNNNIDVKFNLLESMGVDIDALKSQVPVMGQVMRDINFSAKNIETAISDSDIYDVVFKQREAPQADKRESITMMGERDIADKFVKTLMPVYLNKNNSYIKDSASEFIQTKFDNGELPNVGKMTDDQFREFWNEINTFETSTGKQLADYKDLGFDRFREDFEAPIVKNHSNILLKHVRTAAKELGIVAVDEVPNGGTLKLYDWGDPVNNDEVNFFLERIRDLERMGSVELIGNPNDGAQSIRTAVSKEGVIDNVIKASNDYLDESSRFFDTYQNQSKIDSPSIDYIKEYGNLVQRNRLESMMIGDIREGDNSYESLRILIEDKIGLKVPSKGLRVVGENLNEDETNMLNQYQKLVDTIVEIKGSLGKRELSSNIKEISFDDAKDIFNTMSRKGILAVTDDGEFLIGGKLSADFRRGIYRNSMLKTNLDSSHWVMYSVLRNEFGDSDGKVKLPSIEAFTKVITQEIRNQNNKNIDSDLMQEKISEHVSLYSKMMKDLSQTNLISETYEFQSNGKRAQAVSSFIKDIYDSQSKNGLKNISKVFEEKAAKKSQALDTLQKLLNKKENNELSAEQFLKEFKDVQDEVMDAMSYNNFDEDASNSIREAIDQMRKESGVFDVNSLMNRLLNKEFVNNFADVYDLEHQIKRLANIDRSRTGYSVAYARMRRDMANNWSKEMGDLNKMPVEQAFFEYIKFRGYEESLNLVNALHKSINVDYNIDTNRLIGEVSTREIMDALSMLSSSKHRANIQTFVKKMQDINALRLLSSDKTSVSDNVKDLLTDSENITENTKSILDMIKNSPGLRKGEYQKIEKDLSKEIVAMIESFNRRRKAYSTVQVQLNTFVNKVEETVETPIGEFTEKLKNSGIQSFIIKDSYTDAVFGESKLSDLTLGQAQNKINEVFSSFDAKLIESIKDEELKGTIQSIVKLDNDNMIFVPLQANEDIGIIFTRTAENLTKLRSKFYNFIETVGASIKDVDTKDMFNKHMQSIRENLNKGTPTGISSAIHSMYIHNNISRSMFLDMIGKNEELSRKAQIKAFKYIHHVNSKNAISYDKTTLKMIDGALKAFDKEYVPSEVRREINRRANDGIRIFVYNDESVGADGERVKGTTAYSIIGETVDKIIADNNLVKTAEERDRMILETAKEYNSDADLNSLKQSLVDGVVFGSKDAIMTDAYLMGENFEDGSTAHKSQFHEASSSLIVKGAIRYNKTLNEFMKKNGIDYIVPSSSAKSFENKSQVNQLTSWDSNSSFAENLTASFDGKINKFSLRTFSPESLKYMFPAHSGNQRANTTTSAMHFMDESALKSFSKQLEIDRLTDFIQMQVKNAARRMYTGGLEGFFSESYEETGDFFSHYSATEQLLQWGLDSQNTLVRDSIMRMLRNSTYEKLLSKPKSSVINSFLFSDHTLKSAVYGRYNERSGYLKSFGEIKIPDSKKSEPIDNDVTFAFTLTNNNDFQDYILNRTVDGKVNIDSPELTADIDGSFSDTKKAFDVVTNWLYNKSTIGEAFDSTDQINNFLKSDSNLFHDVTIDKNGKVKLKLNKELIAALTQMREKGIRNFGITVNSHKIPKKAAFDSIVNRIAGFVDAEHGNVIEANNYEIALHHQADQDGDKMAVFMKMPYEVIKSSSRNMALGKEVITVPAERVPFPNIFGSMDDRGKISNSLTEKYSNNPLKYMKTERQSKYIVGSTVKMQGATTFFNVAGVKLFGNPIMKFNNAADGDFAKASDFARITGSITQTILDAWTGVDDAFVKRNAIKNYILFGDEGQLQVNRIPKTSETDGFDGVFKPPARFADPTSAEGKVYRDFITEIYDSIEDVYTSFGDIYEGGSSKKPEFHHLARIYYNAKSLFNNNTDHVFNSLMSRYKREGKRNGIKDENNRNIKALQSSFRKNPDSDFNTVLKNVFTFDKSFDDMIDIHPQLKALHEVVRMGDMMKETEFSVRENDFIKEIFNYTDDKIAIKMSQSEYANVDVSQYFDFDIDFAFNKISQSFKANENLSDNDFAAPRRLGIFDYAIRNKINQLEYSKNFYYKTGQKDRANSLKSEIDDLKRKQEEVRNQIFEDVQKGGQRASLTKVGKYYYNRTKSDVALYQISSSEGSPKYKFVQMIAPDRSAPKWATDGKFVVLNNVISIEPVSSRTAIEGIAMELATQDYYTSMNLSSENADEAIFTARNSIEKAKFEMRKVNSDTFDAAKRNPSIKSDLYDYNRIFMHVQMENLISDLGKISEQYGVSESALLKMAFSPRAVPNKVINDNGMKFNAFKVDQKFTMGLFKHLNDNKHNPEIATWFKASQEIFQNMNDNLIWANGYKPTTKNFVDDLDKESRLAEYNSAKDTEGVSMMNSLIRMSKNQVLIKSALQGFLPSGAITDSKGRVSVRAFDKFETEWSGCRL